jgi:hypothetical protein
VDVEVAGPSGAPTKLRALYDSGAEINLIRTECVEILGHAQVSAEDRPIAKFLNDNNLCIDGAYDLTVGCSNSKGIHKQVDHQRF